MKKINVIILAGLMALSLSSCASTKINLISAENVETLDSKTFALSTINLRADFFLTEKEQVVNIIKNLPLEKIKDDLLNQYGITLDTAAFSTNDLDSKVGQYVSNKGVKTGLWTWESEKKENTPSASMSVVLKIYNTTDPMNLSINTALTDSVSNSLNYVYYESNWSPITIIADKNTAATVKFAKHIIPDFVQTKNGIETYKSYYANNAAPDGSVYVDTTYPVIFNASVNDPGVFMAVDPMYFYNTKIKETYESGKSYTINYEVDRSTFSKYDWSIIYSKSEN